MSMKASKAYVYEMINLGVESFQQMSKIQKNTLITHLIDETTNEYDFIDLLLERLDCDDLKSKIRILFANDSIIVRNDIASLLRNSMVDSFLDQIDTMFMDAIEEWENEKLNFNNNNYGHRDQSYL